MTAAARLRLVLGVVVILVMVALATYHLNETRGRATSTSAQVLGRDLNVGTPYAGLVLSRTAEVGDEVHVGDPLFVIDSATLTYDLANESRRNTPESTTVDANDHLVVEAEDGRVTAVAAEPGTFVQAGTQLATIQRSNSLYVQAQFTLSPKEYARVGEHAAVDLVLPDRSTLTGVVDEMRVTTVDGVAQAVVTVSSPELVDGGRGGLLASGTPVVAQLDLRNDGWVTTVSERVRALIGTTR